MNAILNSKLYTRNKIKNNTRLTKAIECIQVTQYSYLIKQILYDMHDVQTIYKKIKNDNRNVFFLFIKKTFIYLMLTVRLQ